MAYILLLDRDARAADLARFTKTIPRTVNPRTGGGRICWIFVAGDALTPYLSSIGYVAKPYGDVVSTDERRIVVEHVRRIKNPIPLSELQGVLDGPPLNRLNQAIIERAQVLPLAAARDMRNAVIALRSGVGRRLEWLDKIGSPDRVISGNTGIQWAQERDATELALRMGGFSVAALREWTPPADRDDPYSTGLLLGDEHWSDLEGDDLVEERARMQPAAMEEVDEDSLAHLVSHEVEPSLIEADARVLPGWVPVRRDDRRADIQEFADDRGRKIEILNVNATPVEARVGVDLLYYHKSTKSLVGVQYKRLIDKYIHVDDGLRDQLDRMKVIAKALHKEPSSPGHWRVGNDWMYLKLARTRVMDPDNTELIKGLYLPLSYLDLLLKDEKIRGPRGGRRLGYDTVDRYVTSTLFIELIKEGWIGSPPTSPKHLMVMTEEALARGKAAIVAMDHSAETPRERQSRSRGRRSPTSS